MSWVHLASLFDWARGPKAQYDLTLAYRTVFSGNESEVIIADLANFSKFYQVIQTSDLNAETLSEVNGMRKVFAHILAHLDLTEQQLELLRQAAMQELQADRNERG